MAEDGMTLCRVDHDVQACARRGTRSAAPRLSHSPDRCELLFHTLLCAFTRASQLFSCPVEDRVSVLAVRSMVRKNFVRAALCQSPLAISPKEGSRPETIDLPEMETRLTNMDVTKCNTKALCTKRYPSRPAHRAMALLCRCQGADQLCSSAGPYTS